ncbi:MAG: dihydrodipicolinate synthase family protein [Lachnospiraceae bacterium]|nr:dihydrodipicolinate synthase family protein [Lachnospiraceae bacterium]
MRKETKELILKGAFIPAMPLVLDENRSFDEAGQRRLIRYYLECGVDGIAAAVHTTQFEIRDPKVNLFETVLRVAMDEISRYRERTGKNILAIAGVCGPAPQAVKEAELICELGYDAALLSPGRLNDLSEEELVERTRLVAEKIDVIGFYLQTAVGGRVFSYDYWKKICAIEGVAAVKCAAFNRYLTIDVARAIAFSNRDIALYTGNDDNIITDLLTEYRFADGENVRSVRMVGGLLGHWAVWTHTAVEIFRKLKSQIPGSAIDPKWLTLAAQITDANSAFFDTANGFKGCIAGIHEVLCRQGLMPGIWCLNPKEGLSRGQREEIDRVYAQYPHLNDDAFAAEFIKKEGSFS